MQKTCSRCATTFGCQNETKGCWCEDLTLSSETLVHLRQSFDNCLCPTCLAAYEKAQGEASSLTKKAGGKGA
jgi:hypothetical protein